MGDIEGMVLRPGLEPLSPLVLAQITGIVGYQLPPLHASELRLAPADILILATDGLRSDFKRDTRPARPVKETADNLLENYGKSNDDVMVLVSRYLGQSS